MRTGIAACSAELVEALRRRGHDIDLYPEAAAHDFVWRHRLHAYDLVVYQFGNSSHHDYAWAYALTYPGLVVLHDTHLHHARAAFLLRERRAADYRAEFRWNHPNVPPDAAELAVAGFDSRLYYDWPMVRSLVAASRLVAVHGEGTARELRESISNSTTAHAQSTPNSQADLCDRIVSIRLGHGRLVTPAEETVARTRVRADSGIAEDAVLFGVFGGLTPDKRVPQILAAFRAIVPYAPAARLLLGGAPAPYYDIAADIARHGLADRVTLTGYLDTDESLTDHLAACDVTLNLRWPTARETSGPWLRALAAGKATVVTDLAHMTDLASLDPRTWAVNWPSASGFGLWEERRPTTDASVNSAPQPKAQSPRPVCVAIDILDEDHSLRLAMRRLAADAALRAQLGGAAREWWEQTHTVEAMVDDYERVMQQAARLERGRGAGRPDPDLDLPAHMRNTGDRTLETLMIPFGIEALPRRRPGGGA